MRHFLVFYLLEDYDRDFGGVKSKSEVVSSDNFPTKSDLIRHGRTLFPRDYFQISGITEISESDISGWIQGQ